MVVDRGAAEPEVPAHHGEHVPGRSIGRLRGGHGAQVIRRDPGEARPHRTAGRRVDRSERGHREHHAPGRLGRPDAGVGVLHGHAGRRVDAEGAAGREIGGGVGLGAVGVVGGDGDREAPGAERLEHRVGDGPGRGGDQRGGHAVAARASSRSRAPGRGTMPARTRPTNSWCSRSASSAAEAPVVAASHSAVCSTGRPSTSGWSASVRGRSATCSTASHHCSSVSTSVPSISNRTACSGAPETWPTRLFTKTFSFFSPDPDVHGHGHGSVVTPPFGTCGADGRTAPPNRGVVRALSFPIPHSAAGPTSGWTMCSRTGRQESRRITHRCICDDPDSGAGPKGRPGTGRRPSRPQTAGTVLTPWCAPPPRPAARAA